MNYRGVYTHCLGERLNGIQEVSGSIPLISTNKDLKQLLWVFCFVPTFIHAKSPPGGRSTAAGRAVFSACLLPHFNVRHFLGQAAAHRPQPTQAAASSFQLLAARSTVMAL